MKIVKKNFKKVLTGKEKAVSLHSQSRTVEAGWDEGAVAKFFEAMSQA